MYFLGFVGFEQWYLAWICLVPLLFALDGVHPKQGLFLGWSFGIVALTGGFYWVAYTIHVFAHMPWAASVIGCLLLSAAQATQFALLGFLYALIKRRSRISPLILATAAFVATEFVCPQLFPHYFGNSQYLRLPLIQICDITGVLGVTAILVLANAAIYATLRSALLERRFKFLPILVAAGVALVVLAYGYMRIPMVEAEMEEYPKLRFGIAQVNLGIREKNLYPAKAIRLNQEQTRKLKDMGADIVVWPETAVQSPILSPRVRGLPRVIFDDLDVPILIGALQRDFMEKNPPVNNIAVLSDETGNILGVYKKQKLLMLGEYIPLGEIFPKLYEWFPYISRMAPGISNEPLKFRDYSLNVNICYEEILPRLMNRMLSRSPHVMVNLTNDNWFGATVEPLQHLVLALFRSVEHKRWLVRSTNTGISAFVDATGRIVERSTLMEPAMMVHEVPMMEGRTTYARLGDWLGWVSVILIVGFILYGRSPPMTEARL